MSKPVRKIILFFFILLFLVISSSALIYAFGYKLDWKNFSLQKTGILVVETTPNNARIFLDNKVQMSFWEKFYNKEESYITTPTKIKHVMPGTYDIKIELDGYWPWKKQLTINPNETIFIENVRLFTKSFPLLIASIENKIIATAISPNKEWQAVLTTDELWLINPKNKISTELLQLVETEQSVDLLDYFQINTLNWSNDSHQLLAGNLIFNTDLDQPKNINKTTDVLLKHPHWHNNKIHFLDDNKLYRLVNDEVELIIDNLPSPISDYLIKDELLYVLGQSTNKSHSNLQIFNLSNQKLINEYALPIISNYQFINLDNQWLNIYDTKKQQLYIVEFNSTLAEFKLKKIRAQTNHWVENNRLLYANDFEIWVWDKNSNQETLLTRASELVTNVFWHTDSNYIIYSTDHAIYSLELDNRDRHHINQLIKVDEIKNPLPESKGKIIYFYSNIEGQQGLFQLII